MLRRQLLLLTLAGGISACGFRLKGTGKAAVSLDAPVRLVMRERDDKAEQTIRETFAERGITFAQGAGEGYEIVLEEPVDTRFESAVGGQFGQSRVLDIRKGFTATIRKDGQTLATQALSSERSINYHSEEYLGSVADDENAQNAILRDNAEKLLRFFQAVLARP